MKRAFAADDDDDETRRSGNSWGYINKYVWMVGISLQGVF